ncbi:MAG: ABC transporter substrate-binding protein [bacterium]|nr:ABC transporter substrate-binding protein [bacterium]
MAACGGNETTTGPTAGSGGETTEPAGGSTEGSETTEPAGGSGESYHIGITQIVAHEALDATAQGFKDALADAGIAATYDEKNAQGDVTTAASIAGTFADGDFDLIFAIATPTAQAAVQAITDVPIVFGAVTDPVEVGLVGSWEEPGANVTGTSDKSPVKEQLELLLQIAPDAETVGVVYSSTEENSLVQLAWAEEEGAKLGLTIETATISTSADLLQAAESLDVDAFYVFTDNTVVSAVETLIGVAEERQIPVIASDGGSVERGATASYAFNYYDMGVQSGEMAIRILEGADPATMPVETSQTLILTVNPDAAERAGIELPQELLDRADETVGE